MPKFRVNDPESGRALLMEGETPPSEQEIEEAFRSVTQQTTGFRDLSAQQPLSLRAPAAPFLPTGPGSTTVGGPRRPLATYGETMAEPAGESIFAPRVSPTEPRLALPNVPIGAQDTFWQAAGKEAVNAVKGLPEFFTSDAGIASLLSGTLAPRLTAAGFSADLTHTAFQQAKQMNKDWGQMTPAQKGVSTVRLLSSMGLAILSGRGAIGKTEVPSVRVPGQQPTPTPEQIAESLKATPIGTIYGEPRINLGGRLAAIARAKTMLPRAAAQAEREVADAVSERVVQEDRIQEREQIGPRGLPAEAGGGHRAVGGEAVEPQVQAGVQPAEVSEAGRQRVLVGNRPAVKTMPDEAGKFTYIEAERLPNGEWETHDQIIERAGLKTDQIDRRVFLDQQGHEKPREQTAQELAAVGEPSKMPGEAHSTDVNRLAQAPQTPLDAAIKEAEASASKVLDEYVAGVWPSEDQMTRVNASIEEVAKKYGIKPNELRRNVLWTVPKPPKEKAPLTGLEAFKQRTQELFGTPQKEESPLEKAKRIKAEQAENALAPFQRKYREVKEANPDAVVLMRLGDFYEAFWEDAQTLSDVAKVTMTKRNNVPMAGVPFHASQRYIETLQRAGKRVVIYEGGQAKPVEQAASVAAAPPAPPVEKPAAVTEPAVAPETSKGDPNIGRTWNSPYGKQTIVRVETFGGRDNYVVATEGTGAERVYSADRIEDVIKRNEHELTPEYVKELAEKRETARLREERDAREREKREKTDAEILEFSKGKSPMLIGRIKKTLLTQVNWTGVVKTRKEAIEAEIEAGAKVERVEGKRQLTKPTGSFFDESATTVAGMDYAEYLQNKSKAPKPEAPKADVARLVQEDASKKVPEARETLDAHETVPTELADKPASLGKWLTRTARPSEKAPETQTSRLTTLQSPDSQRVAVVSTYDHPRYGAMLFDPTGGTKHVSLTTLLKQGWKPIASTLTKEPHSRFRKVFGSMEAYQSEVGQPLAEARAALKTYPAPTQVTQPSLPLGPETVTDPIVAHLAQHPTLNAAIAAIQTAPNRRQIQAAIRSAMDDLQQKNPKLTDEQAAQQVLNTFYEQSRKARPAIAAGPRPAPAVAPAAPAEPTAEAPRAAIAEPAAESPHGVTLDVTTPAEHPLGPIDTGTTPTLSLWQNLSGELKEAGTGLRAFWRAFAMQALPKISAENRVAGEAGVRYDASRRVARAKGIEFAGKVTEGIEDRNLQERIRIALVKFSGRFRPQNLALTFDQKFGTALVEDNLRSIREGFRGEGDTEAASRVTTLIGARNSPFRTEAQYQAFLNDPQTQRVIQKHKQLWDEQKDPIYRKANDLDPDLELETRGLQTGARINLKAVLPGDTTRTAIGGTGRPSLIRQAVTRLRRDPFARQAKGTGQVYEGSYQEIMASGFEREYPIAAQHEFIKQLVDSGLAKVTQQEFPKDLTVRGERPKAYELKIRPWRNYWIQVPRSLAPEFENVMGLTPSWQVPGVRHLSDFLTSASVQGFAEGSTHVSNLSIGILTNLGPTANPMLNALIKNFDRVDVLYTIPRILIRGFSKNQSEMLRLAEIGAAKEPYTGLLGWFINRIDRGVRLVSADIYRGMAEGGWVEDTETGLREYVNQVGQYSKRLQPAVIARLRETGIQPFATAAHTFNVLGLRTMALGPGAKSPTWYGALALRADKASGIMGFILLAATLNKLLSGKVFGPPGTQLGNVGWTDDQGKVKQFPLARLFGYERGPRITGLQSFVEARRLGLPEATALSSGLSTIGGSGLSYVSGPMVQFATKAITGKRPGVPMVQEAKVVPPPSEDELQPFKTQAAANIAAALQQANPAIDASLMVLQGKELPEILRRQFSRYTPRPGMSEATIEAMPKIVHSKQMFDYVSALAKEARKQPRSERNDFINKRLEEDDVTGKDRAEAMRLLKLKGVFRYE